MDMANIGLGSYAYRYNVGINSFDPDPKMDIPEFIQEVKRQGLSRALICENLKYMDLANDRIEATHRTLEENEITAEIGMRDLTVPNLLRHIEIAQIMGSEFIRVVCGKPERFPHQKPDQLKSQVIEVLGEVLPVLEEKSIVIGIENHFDLPTEELVAIARHFESEQIGLILDTTNGLGFIERVEETAEMVMPYLVSAHIKDFVVEKGEAGYEIKGTVLGDGILDLAPLLRRIVREKPAASVILELTISRDTTLDTYAVLSWEKSLVTKSVEVLKATLQKIENPEYVDV